jgi:hypothetical protein
LTALAETAPIKPSAIEISAYPNPFNSAVTIAVDGVGDGSPVPFDVEIYDVNGRMVEGGTVGAYCIRPFDYLVRARVGGRGDLAPTAGDGAATKRIVYLK